MTALLALWAGDDDSARKYLREISKGGAKQSRKELMAIDPLAASALRTLDQLNRRKKEFERLAAAAGIPHEREMCVLRSAGGNLAGVIWVHSDREMEFRVYVTKLAWETAFYRATFERSSVSFLEGHANPPYAQLDTPTDTEVSSQLGLSWSEPGPLLLELDVGDFCTLNVRAIWTEKELPERAEQLTGPLQGLLNDLDPEESAVGTRRAEKLPDKPDRT